MVQHLLLTLAAPPLLLAGLPSSLIELTPVLAALLRRLTAPVIAFASYNAVLVFWHLPLLYGWTMENHGVHIGEHLLFLGTALLLWWPVAGPRLGKEGMAPPVQLLYLFLAGVPMILVAAFVTLADEPLYRFYAEAPRTFGLSPLADQVAGGVIMWVPGSLVYLLAITVVYFRWAMNEREDRTEGVQDGSI
jgi:putative membrane protein